MTTFFALLLVVGLLVGGLGVLVPLPIYKRKRLWALVSVIVTTVVGTFGFDASLTPAEKARMELDQQLKKEFAEVRAKQPKSGFSITEFSWEKECGGFCLRLSGTIQNETNRPLKDPEIACETHAESGTELATKKRRLMKTVGAGKSVTFKNFDMGTISDDTHRIRCDVISSRSI